VAIKEMGLKGLLLKQRTKVTESFVGVQGSVADKWGTSADI